MTDEEAVRAAWTDATEWPFITSKGNGVEVTDKADYDDMEDALILGEGATSAEAWSAARAFKEEREKQIADVEEEIEFLFEGAIPFKNSEIRKRILAREQAALAKLKKGWKEQHGK